MKRAKQAKLAAAGWKVGNAAEFLNLTSSEQRFVEMKLALATGLRRFRERRGLTQTALAKKLGSSQSRVAKMEAGDASVSLDLMVRSLFIIGVKPTEIASLIKNSVAA